MKIVYICLILVFFKLNLTAHEIDCTETSCTDESIDILNDYQKRQLEKKILQTMTLMLDRLQQKILLEMTK